MRARPAAASRRGGRRRHGSSPGRRRGFGRIWAEAALERGDRVAATARDASSLDALVEQYGDAVLPIALDVTDKGAVDTAVARAHDHFGRLDIVVNNAGYGLFGAIEEVTEAQARAQIETNLFGALWVTKAALPHLREQRSGHIIQVSSIGGVNAFPTLGLYHASKWGLEGFSQALAQEVADFGIRVTIIEPAGFSTDWRGPSAVVADQMPEYQPVRDYRAARAGDDTELFDPGDPEATGPVVLELVDAEEPPLRLFLGTGTLNMIKDEYAKRIAEWEQWDHLAVEAQGGVKA